MSTQHTRVQVYTHTISVLTNVHTLNADSQKCLDAYTHAAEAY